MQSMTLYREIDLISAQWDPSRLLPYEKFDFSKKLVLLRVHCTCAPYEPLYSNLIVKVKRVKILAKCRVRPTAKKSTIVFYNVT